eukprot:jgi/Chlat1/8240/Chrsp77S00621
MGKYPVRLKEASMLAVIYALSPNELNVMSGLWKDLDKKLAKKIKENWVDNLFLVVPIVGTVWYANDFKEKEKMHHRY